MDALACSTCATCSGATTSKSALTPVASHRSRPIAASTTGLRTAHHLKSAAGRQQLRATPRRGVPRAKAHDPHDPVISGVDELKDGFVVLHFAEETEKGAKEHVDEVVTFLTKPVQGQKKRQVSEDTLDELVGEHPDHNPVKGMASFVKNVMSPSSTSGTKATSSAPATTNGAATPASAPASQGTPGPSPPPPKAPVTTSSAPSVAPSATAVEPEATVPKVEESEQAELGPAAKSTPGAPAQKAQGEVSAGKGGLDVVRVLIVAAVSALLTLLSRLAATRLGLVKDVALQAPVSLAAVAVLFVFAFAFLWNAGFAGQVRGAEGGAA